MADLESQAGGRADLFIVVLSSPLYQLPGPRGQSHLECCVVSPSLAQAS